MNTAGNEDGYSDARSFALTVERVHAYVQRRPGAWSDLSRASRDDPDGTTRGLLALGTVLLDIAAEAYRMSPEQMLDKVSRTLAADHDAVPGEGHQ